MMSIIFDVFMSHHVSQKIRPAKTIHSPLLTLLYGRTGGIKTSRQRDDWFIQKQCMHRRVANL